MEYKTVKEAARAELTIKKSEFIGHIAPAQTDEQATEFIKEIRAENRKANHNCYAYILRHNHIARHSDDGEPSGTAGVPIHEVLAKAGLTDVVCVVTRYFGGILLGAGGLVRAYSGAASLAVESSRIKVMASAVKLRVTVSYPLYGLIGGLLNEPQFDIRIDEEVFSDKVEIYLFVRTALAPIFTEQLIDLCNGNADIEGFEEIFYDFGK